MMTYRFPLFLLVVLLAACGTEAPEPRIHSYLEGQIRVRVESDSVEFVAGFTVLATNSDGNEVDTLGLAVTDENGRFAMDIAAPEAGVYPLMVYRDDALLALDELVVSAGDSATLSTTLPRGRSPMLIRSPENSAWRSYQTIRQGHAQRVRQMQTTESVNPNDLESSVRLTADMMWNLQQQFPGTVGAELAAAESILLLEGFDDPTVVARADSLSPENPSFVDAARAARRSMARLRGQIAALALLRDFQTRTPDEEDQAALQSEIVLALIDSLDRDAALVAARELQAAYPGTQWDTWAERAIYEVETLLPGMPAPAFVATTRQGERLALDSLKGQVVLLEFYEPLNQRYLQEFALRNALYQAAQDAPTPFTMISISVREDSVLNDALFDGRTVPGHHIYAPGGLQGGLAEMYNVNRLPTRFLLNPDGTIRAKYIGATIDAVWRDLGAVLAAR